MKLISTDIVTTKTSLSRLLIGEVTLLAILAISDNTRPLVVAFVACVGITLVHLFGILAVGLLASAPIERICIFFGPPLA